MRPIGAEKFTFEEMKRREMSRTGKNEIILTCPCANRLRSARLNIQTERRVTKQNDTLRARFICFPSASRRNLLFEKLTLIYKLSVPATINLGHAAFECQT